MSKQNKSSISGFTKVKPYNETEAKTSQLSRMFNTISGKYDQFNDIMTWGLARDWRRKSLKKLGKFQPKKILDIAAGTGDMCIQSVKLIGAETVVGVDISEKMIGIAKEKTLAAGLSDKISFEIQDVASLPYPDSTFDAATIAFGIRNFEKLEESLKQINRVLVPNGHLLILEMNEPDKKWIYSAYRLYTKVFVKLTAKLLSADARAYDYLTTSMKVFASGKQLLDILNENGFKTVRYRKFFFGVCSMYLMQKR